MITDDDLENIDWDRIGEILQDSEIYDALMVLQDKDLNADEVKECMLYIDILNSGHAD